MLFLLTVVLVAVWLGRGPAVFSAFLSVALFDFFFVPPKLSFGVSDAQYVLTFAVMLTVALITGQLTAGLRREAQTASMREGRTRALYEMGRELSAAVSRAQAAAVVQRFLRQAIGAEALILIKETDGRLQQTGDIAAPGLPALDPRLLALATTDGEYVDLDSKSAVGYFPLKAAANVRGLMAVSFADDGISGLQEHHELLEAVASLMAVVVERLHYVDVANARQLDIQTERLRSSILSALSHDIRTPLTALTGLADALSVSRPALSPAQNETAIAIRDQALRLSGLVANLLDMAKLNAGDVKLRKEWQPLEEVIGSSIKLLERSLANHIVQVSLPAELALLEFDSVLIERVFCNLLENAAKYAQSASAIEISARDTNSHVEVSVRDHGPGVPEARQAAIFDMFVRGTRESSTPGIGLGLAISRAIVESHGGTISVRNEPSGGACFRFTLPKGTPPPVQVEEAETNAA
jgi:two-component system sensor histidine kinase KdpD